MTTQLATAERHIETEQWYSQLVEDCKDIITEAVFTSRWALVEGYHQLGERIRLDADKKSITELLQGLAVDIKQSERTLWYAVQFYDKYPQLDNVPEGKNISWNKLLTKYLPHVAHNSGNNEWYTPQSYIEAAREAMGSIDVDPASSDTADKTVKAATHYTVQDDGRQQSWKGNVWLNPPYAQPLVTEFCKLLCDKYESNEIQQACVLVNNATETNFYQDMLRSCSAVCFIRGRVKFVDEAGVESGAPLQGQTVLYFGKSPSKFAQQFGKFGAILYAGARENPQSGI